MNKFYVYKNEDTVLKTYTVTNNGPLQTSVEVSFIVPQGLMIYQVSPSKGTFDKTIGKWSVGTLTGNETVTIHVTFSVTNINLAPYDVEAQISSNEGGLHCENHLYIEKSLSECVDCDKVYPIFPAFSAVNGSYTAKTLNFVNNQVSFSTQSNGIAAYFHPGSIYINSDLRTLNAIKFQNDNNVSFGLSGSVVTAEASFSVTHPVQIASASNSSMSFETLNFGNYTGASMFISDGSVLVSVNTAAHSFYLTGNTTISNSQTYNNDIYFSGAGVLSIGHSSNSFIFSVPQNYVQSINGSSGIFSFANGNGITFGGVNGSITASHNGLTSQSAQVVSASGQSSNFQSLIFGNSNSISFYLSNSSIFGSIPAYSLFNIYAPGSTYSTTVSFVNANGVSFTGGTGGISASIATQIVTNVSNSNNVSLGINAGLLTASVSYPAQTNQTLGLYGLENTTNNTSQTIDARSLSIRAYGDIYVGFSNSSLQISNMNSNVHMSYWPEGYQAQSSTSFYSQSIYFRPIQFNNDIDFNEIYLGGRVSFPGLSTTTFNSGSFNTFSNLTYLTGKVDLGIYTLSGSILDIVSAFSNYYQFKVSVSNSTSNNAGSNAGLSYSYSMYFDRTVGEGTNSTYARFSNSYLSTYSTSASAVTNATSANLSQFNGSLTGIIHIPVAKSVANSFSKGIYFAGLNHIYYDTRMQIQHLAIIQGPTTLDDFYNQKEFGDTVASTHRVLPLAGFYTGNTASSYNITDMTTYNNERVMLPWIVMLNKP